ncbi:efflux RND transporter periplasmic adaptor subunit [Croceibacter atlanticus]|jgi:RND family efflux transporter MFP subunit|uniref:efflux RND transporter periplasmic adaptor subunit n=1 Tax=Croceibacter atlanticus TaxID=313588 RepID=UPI0024BBAEF5|nr:efflux RND transporter periplasmic adaptor subunit [Croceibacter atlanticus]
MRSILKLIVLSLIIVSCGGNKNESVDSLIAEGNIEALKEKRSALNEEQRTAAMQVKKIDSVLELKSGNKNLPLVSTIVVKDTLFNHYLELQGSVETKQNIVISPEYNGLLERIYVKEGQRVNKGQLLAKIDDGGISQQLAQMETQLALAKTTFERRQRLWEQNIGSEIEYLQAKAQYEGQQNSVAQMRSQVGKTTIRAPFTGTIEDVIAEQGTVVASGQTQIMRLVSLEDMYIEAEIPEDYLTSVSENTPVTINFPILNKTVDSKVRQASNYISPTNRTFRIEVAVPNKDKSIKPNLTARLKINDYTSEKALLIPLSVISENADGEQYVYIAEGEDTPVAKRQIIETGRSQGQNIEVLSGLSNGDFVIKEGARTVKEGQELQIKN